MIALIDNYDSFTHNLWQLVRSCLPDGMHVEVIRNDACDAHDIAARSPSHVLLSPGPGHPRDSGLSLSLLRRLPSTPVLGVCLGHQAIAHAYGAVVTRSPRPTHGRAVRIEHDGHAPFEMCPPRIDVALYHSLVVEEGSLPADLLVAARNEHGDVMALRHSQRPHFGLQFHPESFMTPLGSLILRSFLTHDHTLR
ncbi:MAG: aminodeoxychorismate/anthranilate synthase component II [Planctomycetes bacterium]|nr:aminodeoxychorismate/anthranilate synthase component II [Planctomycetota bacterium]